MLCHVLINPPHHRPNLFQNLLWNYDEVMALLHSADGRCVVACLHGHVHTGDLFTDETGLHFIAFDTPMYAEVGADLRYHGPWVVLEACETCLVLRGHGIDASPLFSEASVDESGCHVLTLPVRPM